MRLDWENAEALVHGGAILGGGGGGSRMEGIKAARLALELGRPRVVPLSEIDDNACLVMVSAVGAPAAAERFVQPMDHVRCVTKVAERLREPLGGLIQNEMGGFASANGMIQSAVLDLPIIDAPGNGRAHPLALMGSLGLHDKAGYRSIQAVCGGDPERGHRVEMVVEGSIHACAALVREASIQAGGIVAVARNPISASWVRDTAAVGAVEATAELGRAFLAAMRDNRSTAHAVSQHLRGEVVAQGRVDSVELSTQGGFDIGRVLVNGECELVFWNEYMFIDMGGRRYTFPDLITTFDTSTGHVVNTAEIQEGMEVAVVAARKENLILGTGMRDRALFQRVDEVLKRPVLDYAFSPRQERQA
jgi:uncharacterized protein